MVDVDEERTQALACSAQTGDVFRGEKEDIQQWFDSRAQGYDERVNKTGYVGPASGANVLVKFLEQFHFGADCKILDVGSGTGLVGEELKKLNYTNIDALDPSEASNDIARSKGIYKTFYAEVLGPGLQVSIPSNSYDAVVSVGMLIKGIVKAEGAMDEMVRVVKPGGLICFSISEDVLFDKEYGHEAKMIELGENNSWKLLSKNQEPYLPGHLGCCMFVYQVL